MQIVFGASFAAVVAVLAYRLAALTLGGAMSAFIVGAAIFASGGWPAAAVLFAFFLPSTIISRAGATSKVTLTSEHRRLARSGWQVLANGSVAALCALLVPRAGAPLAAAYAGAFAAASADTWGTELGMLSPTAPVSILTLRAVRAGASGGVTPLGIAATAAGAFFVAWVASLVGIASLWVIALAGFTGALVDSILGASLQACRWCPVCACECETRRHQCGAATKLRRGASWLENDGVNFAATLCGAAIAMLVSAV